MNAAIILLPGDGIGPEIVGEAVRVLDAVASKWGHNFTYREYMIGGCSIDRYGVALTDETLAACKVADAVLLGAVGGPKWDDPQAKDAQKKACWHCARGWMFLPICARSRYILRSSMLRRSSQKSSRAWT